jgi:hypothetical protein
MSNVLLEIYDDFRVFHTDSTSKRNILVSMSQSLVWLQRKEERKEKRQRLLELKRSMKVLRMS